MPEAIAPDWTSLLPAAVTIILAFTTRQVILALAAGIVTGSLVLASQTGMWADANPITSFLFPAIGSASYAKILLIYLWCLGGLLGMWERTGSALHFARVVGGRVARGRQSSLFFTWLLGVVFHQGGTVSTVLTAATAKPVADAHRVSHEELSYVVDSTASPIATVLAFNAWPAYVGGVVAGTFPLLPDAAAGVAFFWSSVPFNFYGMIAVLCTLGLALGVLPWVGAAMKRARARALETGQLDAPGAQLLVANNESLRPARNYTPHLIDFFLPLSVLLCVAILPYLLWREDWVNEAFLGAVATSMITARVRGMSLAEVFDGFVSGCSRMTIGAIVLGLAITLGQVSKDLGTGQFVVDAIAGQLPMVALPALLTALCMAIAFATGSSWGTYAVVFPLALPLAWSLHPDATYLQICFGAVLGGAVFGDQCSPISDTTILSSTFSGCDLMDHVRTQLPLALSAATLGALLSTLCAALF